MNKPLSAAPPLSAEALRAARARIERRANLFDQALRVPGTRWRIGLESILGLVPVAGDVLGVALSAVIIFEAWRIGAPRPLLGRMLGIAAADALLGLVPVLGDVADFAFKANRINARMLDAHLQQQELRLGVVVVQAATAGGRRIRWVAMAVLAVLALAALLWLRPPG
jgi:hypothetical protein